MQRSVVALILILPVLAVGCGPSVVQPHTGGNSTGAPRYPAVYPASDGTANATPNSLQSLPTVSPESVGAARPESGGTRYHTIASGETLSAIARRYGLSLGQLRQANGLDTGEPLQVGQILFIPATR